MAKAGYLSRTAWVRLPRPQGAGDRAIRRASKRPAPSAQRTGLQAARERLRSVSSADRWRPSSGLVMTSFVLERATGSRDPWHLRPSGLAPPRPECCAGKRLRPQEKRESDEPPGQPPMRCRLGHRDAVALPGVVVPSWRATSLECPRSCVPCLLALDGQGGTTGGRHEEPSPYLHSPFQRFYTLTSMHIRPRNQSSGRIAKTQQALWVVER